MKYYTGIGSRETPTDILNLMTEIARKLGALGWTLRSGGAEGADTAFERGFGAKQVFLPWSGFADRQLGRGMHVLGAFHPHLQKQAYDEASAVHPAWDKCSAGAKKLHARNVFQVFGPELNLNSKFVICWTPGGKTTGGTATAIRLAEKAKIPVFNLANPEHRARLEKFVQPVAPVKAPPRPVKANGSPVMQPSRDQLIDRNLAANCDLGVIPI